MRSMDHVRGLIRQALARPPAQPAWLKGKKLPQLPMQLLPPLLPLLVLWAGAHALKRADEVQRVQTSAA